MKIESIPTRAAAICSLRIRATMFVLVAASVFAGLAGTAAQSPARQEPDKIRFSVRLTPVDPPRLGIWQVAVTVHADKGWHVYSPGADEFLIPVDPKIVFPDGVSEFAPWKFPDSTGGSGHLTDGQTFSCSVLTGDPGLFRKTRIKLQFQACSESVCLPPKTVELDLANATIDSEVGEKTSGQEDQAGALDVLHRPVNNRAIYRAVLELAKETLAAPGHPDIDELDRQLKNANAAAKVPLPETVLPDEDAVYQAMVRSSLIVADIYDCGKCDQQHVATAGGVVISDDGLALTNFHVIEKDNPGTFGLVAITSQGTSHPVLEILSASRADDVALIRLGGDLSALHPAPLADRAPGPMTPLFVLSHPHREYFVLTEGRVSRYVADLRSTHRNTVWMETTADYGAGSSGSAVFNERGQVIGLVATVSPLIRRRETVDEHAGEDAAENSGIKKDRGDLLEMLLHRCVPLTAIQNRFRAAPETDRR